MLHYLRFRVTVGPQKSMPVHRYLAGEFRTSCDIRRDTEPRVEQLGDYGVFVVCVMPPPPLLGPPPPLCGSAPELGSAGKCTPPGAGAVVGAGDGLGIGAAATGPNPNSSVDVATPAAIAAALAKRFRFIPVIRSPRTRGGVILVTFQAGTNSP